MVAASLTVFKPITKTFQFSHRGFYIEGIGQELLQYLLGPT